MSQSKVNVVLTLDGDNLTVGVERANQKLSEFQTKVKSTHNATREFEGGLGAMTTKFKDLVFGISILRFAFSDFNDIILKLPVAFIKAGGEMERIQTLMMGLSKQTTELAKKTEALKDTQFIFNMAANVPFEVKTLTDMFVKMKTAGLDPADGSMKALTNSLAKYGATGEQAKRASIAIQQMAGKGVISMEELRQQLGEAVPNAMQMMARGMGMSMAELTKAVSKGTVESTMALKKMLVEMEIDASGSAAKFMSTLPGMLEALKTQWELFKIQGAGGAGGLEDSVKKQIGALTAYLGSVEGLELGRKLGRGFASAVEAIVAMKDALVAVLPILKVAVSLATFYFGGRIIKAGADSLTNQYKKQKEALNEVVTANKKAVADKVAAIQTEIDKNNNFVKAKQTTITVLVAAEEAAYAKRKAMAASELQLAKTSSAQQIDALARRKEVLKDLRAAEQDYQDWKTKSNRQMADAYSGRAGANPGNFDNEAARSKDILTRRQEQLAIINKEIIGLRNLQNARISHTQTEVNSLAAGNAQLAAMEKKKRAVLTEIDILKNANGVLSENINKHETASARLGGYASTIMGFGATLLKGIGWSIAFSLALEGVVWIYNKLAGSAKRAAEEIERVTRIKAGDASQDDLTKKKADVNDIRLELKRLYADLKNTPDVLYNTGDRKQSSKKQDMKDRIADLESRLREAQQLQEKAQRAVDKAEDLAAGEKLSLSLSRGVDDELHLTDIWKKLTEVGTKLNTTNKESNKATWERLNKEHHELTLQMLDKRAELTTKAFMTALPKAQASGERAEALLRNAYQEQVANIAGNRSTVMAKPIFIGGKPDVKGAKDAVKESPLMKEVAAQQLILNQGRIAYQGLIADARDFAAEAEKSELAKIVENIVSGKYDIAPSPGKNGLEVGGTAKQKAELQKRFNEWTGSAEDFISTIVNVNERVREGESPIRSYILQLVKGAAETAEITRAQTAFQSIAGKQAAVTQELADTSAEYSAGLSYIPSRVASVSRELATLANRAGLTGDRLKELKEQSKGVIGDTILNSAIKDAIAGKQAATNAQIQGIYNVQERERAAHLQKMKFIDDEETARKEEARETITDAEKLNTALARYEEAANYKRIVENRRFGDAYMTELDRQAKGWNDLSGNIDKMMADSSKEWLDHMFAFTMGTEKNFSDLIESTLKQFARLAFDKAMGSVFQKGFNALGEGAKSMGALLSGAGDKQQAAAPDTSTLALKFATEELTYGFQNLQQDGVTSMMLGISENSLAQSQSLVVVNNLNMAMTEAIAALYGLAAASSSAAGTSASSGLTSFMGIPNALGGIVGPGGKMSLQKYARGGIAKANQPQVAIFGEGSMNEAYVPLPDGRSIPVSLKGGQDGGVATATPPAVTVNVINQSGQQVTATQKGSPRFDGRQMILDVVLDAASKPGPFRDGFKSMNGAR